MYCDMFPNRQHPNFKIFTADHNRLRETRAFKCNNLLGDDLENEPNYEPSNYVLWTRG